MTFPGSRFAVLALVLPALWLAAPRPVPTSGNVLVVVANGPYPTVQSAIDAAVDGDVILVRPGNFPGFVVANKSVVVLGDLGAQTRIQGGIRVVDLAAERTVVLANLQSTGTPSLDVALASGIYLANNDGHIRVEACVLSSAPSNRGCGANVADSTDVAFVGCELRGGASSNPYTSGFRSEGLAAAEGSVVTLYGCFARGGNGTNESCSAWTAPNGGDGGDVRQSFLFSANSTLRGGIGGNIGEGSQLACPSAGSGGDGIIATNATIHLLDTMTVGGLPGHGTQPGCGNCSYSGYVGRDRRGSQFSDLAGEARMLSTTTPGMSGTTATVTLRGTPGDEVTLLISGSTGQAEFVPSLRGMLLVPRPGASSTTRVVPAGTIPANGVLGTPLVLPTLAPGARAETFFVQAVFRDPQRRRFLSGARSLTVLP